MRCLYLVLVICLPVSGLAEDRGRLNVSLGYDDFLNVRSPSLAVGVEYVMPGFGPGDQYHLAFAGMATADIDAWIGMGLSWERPIKGTPWFVELSFMPGIFYRKDEKPGVSKVHFPMFRTQGAIGYDFGNGQSTSLAVSHHSAAAIDADAGNTETIWLRYGFDF